MQEREKIKELFDRYQKGQCTPEEQARLHNWFNHYVQNEAYGLDDLVVKFQQEEQHVSTERSRRIYPFRQLLPYVAAILILGLGTSLFLFLNRDGKNGNNIPAYVDQKENDILPGKNRAQLTMADGTTIELDDSQNGIVVSADNIAYNGEKDRIVKLDKGAISQLALSTPMGGTYQLTLSDGTKVWLNAGSTFRYPTQFANNERVVEIEGEAYFSVVKDKNRPFSVMSRGQKVKVLGTEFNISAYSDDSEVKTTLVSGAIQLQAGIMQYTLVPGDQTQLLENGSLIKQVVDVEPFIAWKKGEFYFENTSLTDMLKQLSRWYNVEVIYERKVPNERFSGTMSRNVTLQTVLKLLKISEIKYRVEKNRLIIE